MTLKVPDKELKEQLCSFFTRDLQDPLTCQVDLKVPHKMLLRCLIRSASATALLVQQQLSWQGEHPLVLLGSTVTFGGITSPLPDTRVFLAFALKVPDK